MAPASTSRCREAAAAPAGPVGASAAAAPPPRATRGRDELGIGQADLDRFERALGEVQAAYAAEDVTALRRLATPEVVSVLAEELTENAGRGVVNHVTDVKLLQGDVAESWREQGREYATVAMQFGLRDWTTDRATGRVVEGDPDRPTEATESGPSSAPRRQLAPLGDPAGLRHRRRAAARSCAGALRVGHAGTTGSAPAARVAAAKGCAGRTGLS